MSQAPQYEPPPHGFRTFVILWASQSVSVFGSALTWFAVTIWLVNTRYRLDEQKPELAFALTAIGLTYIITLALSPFAGSWADRHDRKRTMLASDLLNGAVSLTLMTLMITGLLETWLLILLMAAFAAISPFHYAAFDTSYAMIVPEKQLPRANGMMQTIWSLSGVVSPAIAAGIIALPELARQGIIPGIVGDWLATLSDGAALAIGVDGVTFLFAALVLAFLHVPSPKHAETHEAGAPRKKHLWADIKLGVTYIKHRPPLLWLLLTFTVINFAGAPIEIFIPLLLKFNLAPDWQSLGFTIETALATIATVGAIGGVVGGVLMSTWGGLKGRKVYGVLVPILIAGIVQVVYGLSGALYLTAAMNFLLLALIPIMNSHSQTIWQTQVPRHLQGRVFAVRRVIAQISGPVALMMAGIAGAQLNPGWIVAVLGAVVIVFATFQLFNPYLLRVEDKDYLDDLARRRGETQEQVSPRPAEPAVPDVQQAS
jgi:MFS family permease